ncbi:hypothetical protein B9G98_00722 [Wickerhamiella sorbophila]|uniref:Uncharacterized protein n=1 Tax=Wickerhamiella sorbophila TaxID=45607 RepID=A0A2T0FDM6_9ASCO|nr:hypothetical protein B9G98_00722 [Wickerhamiella sorbophila]PRT53102.1 hypothetical protein B9G98_00722 [Wickerhamiella sorbophila]
MTQPQCLKQCSETLDAIVESLGAVTCDIDRVVKVASGDFHAKIFPVKTRVEGDSAEDMVERALASLQYDQSSINEDLAKRTSDLQAKHQPVGGPVRRWQSERIRQLKEELSKI